MGERERILAPAAKLEIIKIKSVGASAGRCVCVCVDSDACLLAFRRAAFLLAVSLLMFYLADAGKLGDVLCGNPTLYVVAAAFPASDKANML